MKNRKVRTWRQNAKAKARHEGLGKNQYTTSTNGITFL